MSDSSTSATSATQHASRDRLRARLRDQRSRLLSLLGRRNVASVPKSVPLDSPSAEHLETCRRSIHSSRSEAITTNADVSPSTTFGDEENEHTGSSSPPPSPCRNQSILPELARQLQARLRKSRSKTQTHPQFRGTQESVTMNNNAMTEGARTQSSPGGISEVFTRKLSVAFGPPTVIRRTHLRSRPSIPAVSFQVAPESSLSTQGDSANDSSDPPSSSPKCSGSPVSTSTHPTSVTPSTPPLTLDILGKESGGQRLQHLSPSGGEKTEKRSWAVVPTIRTVEATANAKVFLETYFDTVYSGVDLRTQRQRELEQYLYALPLAPEEKSRVWESWIVQEHEYLRQCRVLKTCSVDSHQQNTSLAGFEVIKTLGRGSFGVVRLVREKTSCNTPGSPTRSPREWSIAGRRRIMTGAKKEAFAMKVIRKSAMIRNCQESHLRAERDFLVASMKSQWIVPLIASFQDHNFLYLIMDYMIGGDFLGLLMRKCILPEQAARWYVAEMILCIEEAHRLCWIHRDVKPDNFLISASGHLKISDFGLAFDGHWAHDQEYYNDNRYSLVEKLGLKIAGDTKDRREEKEAKEARKSGPSYTPPTTGVLEWRDQNQRRRYAQSIVGTSQYMAPEVVRGHPYDGRCDWWSVGIILYECLYGCTPFASKDRHETKWKIHNHLKTLAFPTQKTSEKLVSSEAIDLISNLLHEKEYRLSCAKYRTNDYRSVPRHLFCNVDIPSQNPEGFYVYPDDAVDIKAHPFFHDTRWEDLHRTPPPFIPRVKGWEDTRYFDDASVYDENDSLLSSEGGWSDSTEENAPEVEAQTKQLPQTENRAKTTNAKPAAPKMNAKYLREKGANRPRDKLLRDKEVGKTVLEMRKKGAFVGYTYRRPKTVAMAFAPDRGRSSVSQYELFEAD
ncbi:kinase-like domain-containing protein [Aspergillus ambiguus]|uniref:serine/threonine-protein kinase n=1 Tax=Aspergillus ambiguus TaxID=176160 RepID=UPI003CCE4F04